MRSENRKGQQIVAHVWIKEMNASEPTEEAPLGASMPDFSSSLSDSGDLDWN